MDKNRICWSWAKDIMGYTHMLLIFFQISRQNVFVWKVSFNKKKLTKTKKELKGYILLFSCSASRDVYFELLPNLTTSEFIRGLKRLIARRGIT